MYIGMPKVAKVLSSVAVNRLNRVGWHAVGGVAGLLLQIRKPASEGSPLSRSWILRVRIGNERKPLGLGPYPQVSLAEARELAKKLVLEARQGVDLVARKKEQRSALILAATQNKSFKECAKEYMDAQAQTYRNDKHRKQWSSTLEAYAYPVIGNLLVSDIKMHHVLNVMLQKTTGKNGRVGKFWYIKTETAKRVLGRIKKVLDCAIVSDYRTGTNPARWTGYLDTQLPSPSKITKRKHHSAIPYSEIGDFMDKLRAHDGISAKALQFLILTGVRSGSVRMAKWSEINISIKLWVIPAEHTKTQEEHRVPLAPQALKLLRSLSSSGNSSRVFPSPKGSMLSDASLSAFMRDMRKRGELGIDAVPHGFRSTFRDWAAELTSYSDEIRKAASGHVVGDAVQQAYQRTDLLEKRRRMMIDWANFLEKPSRKKSAKVSPIRKSI